MDFTHAYNARQDTDGHGTHVAATAGGLVYGVAKNVQLIPVRVTAAVSQPFPIEYDSAFFNFLPHNSCIEWSSVHPVNVDELMRTV